MVADEVPKLDTLSVLIFKHFPEPLALLRTEVSLVVLKAVPDVFPFIVVAPIKFGAVIFYPPNTNE